MAGATPIRFLKLYSLLPWLLLPVTVSAWFQPTLDATFVYDLDNTPIAAPEITTSSGLVVNEQVYIVDMEGSTASQIANYKAQGKTVICYFSAGSWEPGRSDALSFSPACYCGSSVSASSSGECTGSSADQNKLDGWNEWWLDIRAGSTCLAEIKPLMTARMAAAKAKGCDGVDPDNVDGYTNTQQFGITAEDEVAYLLWLSETAHGLDLSADLKNSGDLLVQDGDSSKATQWQAELVAAFEYSVIESCREYSECDIYSSFLAAGKPQFQVEYSSSIKTCPSDLSSGQKLAVYSGTNLDSGEIVLECQGETSSSGTASSTGSLAATSSAARNGTASSGGVVSGTTSVVHAAKIGTATSTVAAPSATGADQAATNGTASTGVVVPSATSVAQTDDSVEDTDSDVQASVSDEDDSDGDEDGSDEDEEDSNEVSDVEADDDDEEEESVDDAEVVKESTDDDSDDSDDTEQSDDQSDDDDSGDTNSTDVHSHRWSNRWSRNSRRYHI